MSESKAFARVYIDVMLNKRLGPGPELPGAPYNFSTFFYSLTIGPNKSKFSKSKKRPIDGIAVYNFNMCMGQFAYCY